MEVAEWLYTGWSGKSVLINMVSLMSWLIAAFHGMPSLMTAYQQSFTSLAASSILVPDGNNLKAIQGFKTYGFIVPVKIFGDVGTEQPLLGYLQMSRLMRKPTICIGENTDADQLRGNREADQRLCFRYSDSTIPLLLKSEISSF